MLLGACCPDGGIAQRLGTLQRLAARGKLHAALAWIHDFLRQVPVPPAPGSH